MLAYQDIEKLNDFTMKQLEMITTRKQIEKSRQTANRSQQKNQNKSTTGSLKTYLTDNKYRKGKAAISSNEGTGSDRSLLMHGQAKGGAPSCHTTINDYNLSSPEISAAGKTQSSAVERPRTSKASHTLLGSTNQLRQGQLSRILHSTSNYKKYTTKTPP